MRKNFRTRTIAAMVLALALVASACSSNTDGPTIEIASFGFGESEIVAEIYKQALEAEGYSVNHQVQVGPREVLKPALVLEDPEAFYAKLKTPPATGAPVGISVERPSTH